MELYKYGYRFNAFHNMTKEPEGKHIHSFFVVFYIKQEVKMFFEAEKKINAYMEKYRGRYINEVMKDMPTVENIGELILEEINELETDFTVVRLEISDSAIQTYIIGVDDIDL